MPVNYEGLGHIVISISVVYFDPGTSWDGWNIRTGSSTHNTGAGDHCDRDRYTSDGSRQAGPLEQGMIQDTYGAWQRDGQPLNDWSYNPITGRAEGPNANRRY